MKSNRTELVFILDRSGSMQGLEQDTIGGYNALLQKQKEKTGETIVTTVLFDDEYELLHDRSNIKGIAPLNGEQYYVRGCTALLDAIGKTINKIGNAHKHTAPAYRPGKVIVAITTDGLENASCEFSASDVRAMVERQQTKYGWEFLFLGANIDAIAAAKEIGIKESRAANYYADSTGTKVQYEYFNDIVSCLRENKEPAANWQKQMECEYQSQKADTDL